ncbi:Hermansky-Pudlak syndrome 1 protein homolog isoform X2 [Diaphorina citri]|uniref:Hermansky-Pudlak syndrome 1 protein homolog isoform X1 n=1 Tax=Diaphorina citri TaxID=121845 RepID=A0A3Q0JDU0_DIACI|nr:Hermansky-Pudlak syndrome 1 protein homolog isoform X1 [Diaphorina citri]XP_026686616.1 Hermansky-Pudlak syndrome 1 protein homolog isoform X2 [Diaphorina citri]
MKCLFEILKRKRGSVKSAPSHLTKQLSHKWDNIKKCFSEFSKHDSDEHLVRIESNLKPFVDQLRSLTRFLCLDQSVLILLETPGKKSTQLVYHQLKNFIDFLCIKAFKNFDLSSGSTLSIHKYLQDFPGLVHFIYVDRKTHRVVAPTLDLGSKQCLISADKLWKMVDMGQQYLHDGYLQIIWKDSTFSYSYFCWFENSSGAPLKPSRTPVNAMEYVSIPGILCGDFYQRLISKCFVKKSGGAGGGGLSGVKCYELYCVHLSLATSSCILEHTRRLAATVWEVSGIPSVNTDFV